MRRLRRNRPAIVSIHSRLLGREILPGAASDCAGRRGFNPLPAFGPGDTPSPRAWRCQGRSFNPLPAFGPGDTWMPCANTCCQGFQSTPGFWAGRYAKLSRRELAHIQFQSTPGFWAGRYFRCRIFVAYANGFNPLPAFGPGDTWQGASQSRQNRVSIHSRLLGREIRHMPQVHDNTEFYWGKARTA